MKCNETVFTRHLFLYTPMAYDYVRCLFCDLTCSDNNRRYVSSSLVYAYTTKSSIFEPTKATVVQHKTLVLL